MTNRSDESRAWCSPDLGADDAFDGFPRGHGTPQDKYQSVAPGQTIEFEFTLNYPGVFMYHCGTPVVPRASASLAILWGRVESWGPTWSR